MQDVIFSSNIFLLIKHLNSHEQTRNEILSICLLVVEVIVRLAVPAVNTLCNSVAVSVCPCAMCMAGG